MGGQDEARSGKDEESGESDQTMSLWQTTQSVMFAMLGVQKSKNAKRDFSKGKASHFIIMGIVFGVLFILSIALVVNLVLSSVVVP